MQMIASDRSAYRSIVKGTAIFGGVQVFNILINILRGKFIALFLGPAGMGVSALLTSTVNTINQVSSLGLSMGAVRDISMANEKDDVEKLSLVTRIFRRLVLITGIAGAVISVAGAKWWSRIAFGNEEYTLAFVILGAMLFFTVLASGETALLQGTRHLKDLARTSLASSAVGLVVGVPMYYLWGTDGIAPAMVALALTTYLSNRYFAGRIKLAPVKATTQDTAKYARGMIALGMTLTLASLLGTLSTYFLNWFIRYNGGIDDVGLYQAVTSITTQYIGFVFSAMAVDYYPRLAAISHDNAAISRTANQQAEIVLLISAPIVIALLATAPLVVRILLSEAFMPTIPVLRWMGFALFFKAAAYALGYISFAKGDKKTFFWLEGVLGNLLITGFSVAGYLIWGYAGLGIAMLGTFVCYLIVVSVVVYRKYEFRFARQSTILFCKLLGCCLLVFASSFLITDRLWYGIAAGTILITTGWFCLRELNRKIHLAELIKNKLNKS